MKQFQSAIVLGNSLIVLLLCFFSYDCPAQKNKVFKHITQDNGLPSNKVNCIAQDNNGIMWFGTASGLASFDGSNIKTYEIKLKNTEHHDFTIFDVHIKNDKQQIWIATNSGIILFDKSARTFTNNFGAFAIDSILGLPLARKVIKDSCGNLWVKYASHGAFKVNMPQEQIVNINRTSGKLIDIQNIKDIEELPECKIIIGGYNGLIVINNKTNKHHTVKGLRNQKIHDIHIDKKGRIWASAKIGGVFAVREHESYYRAHSVFNKKINIVNLTVDNRGHFYYSQRASGLNFYHRRQKINYYYAQDIHNPNGINSENITDIFCDIDGNIWTSYADKGISYIDNNRKPFLLYQVNFKSNGLPNNRLNAAYQSSDSLIWLSSVKFHLSTFNPATGEFKNDWNKNFGQILSITEIAPNALLLGTHNRGIFIYNYKNNTSEQIRSSAKNGLIGNIIRLTYTDMADSVWVSTSGRLFLFNPDNKKFTHIKNAGFINDILAYTKDTVCLAKHGEILFYSHKAKSFTTKNIGNDNITQLCLDLEGNIWGTTNSSGVFCYRLRDDNIKFYSTKEGLASNTTRGIECDYDGNIWISSINGLSRLNTNNGSIKNYDKNDGLQGNEFLEGISLKTRNNHLLFGGSNGFNYFAPSRIKTNKVLPVIQLVDFKLFNTTVEIGENTPLQTHISLSSEIKLKHNQNFFSIEYVGVGYTASEKFEYAYRLQNFEKEWNYVSKQRIASYTNIPHGNYTFEVKAANNDDIWTKPVAKLKIVIQTPWYKTVFFRLFIILLLASVMYFLYRYRVQSMRRHQKQLEKLVNERTKELNSANEQLKEKQNEILEQKDAMHQMKLQFFTNISHEFRTPLTLLKTPIQKLKKNFSKDEANKYLPIIERNTDTLLHLVNEIMDFRKLDAGHMKISVSKVEFMAYCKEISSSFEATLKSKSISFQMANDLKKLDVYIDKNKVSKVLSNLISNAIKFTPEHGTIKLFINDSNKQTKADLKNKLIETYNSSGITDYFEFSVEDNGIGISKESIPNIFGRFYQLESTKKHLGSGIGLALVKDLVTLHKGDIIVESEKNKGTRFTIRLPLSKEAYHKNEITSINKKSQGDFNLQEIAEHSNSYKLNEPTILIIDDNDDLRTVLRSHFEEQYQVIDAEDGLKGWEIAIEQSPDIIISDVMMPNKNGYELCSELKTDIRTSHIPIVLLTAKSSEQHKMEGLQTGADLYISKPFDIEMLNVQVNNIFKTRQAHAEKFAGNSAFSNIEVNNQLDQQLLNKLNEVILSNISDTEFKVENMSVELGISSRNLNRKLKAILGVTPAEYLRNIRLEKALELLLSGEHSISQAADMTGFSHAAHFSRVFKQKHQQSPQDYLKRMKK